MNRPSGVILSDNLYNVIKWAVGIVLPALATLYMALGELWDWPNVPQVVGSITAAATFLGLIAGVSSYQYSEREAAYDGTMRVNRSDDGQLFDLVLDDDPLSIAGKKSIRFRVDTSVPEDKSNGSPK